MAVPRGPNSTPTGVSRAVAAILANEFPELLITQQAFAELVGMSQSTVSLTLLGERVLDLEQFVRWCAALHLDASDVLRAAQASS